MGSDEARRRARAASRKADRRSARQKGRVAFTIEEDDFDPQDEATASPDHHRDEEISLANRPFASLKDMIG